jgi:phosphoglycolate phosphatase-like HAD superfamily hydrolase
MGISLDPQAELKGFIPEKEFLIAIDSDGCVFDTMEIKQKQCVIPNIVRYWDLQPLSRFTRAAAEFVNLYSEWRGINRFPALIKTLDLLGEWPDVQQLGVAIPSVQSLKDWIERETKLSNLQLEIEVAKTADPVLENALEWSRSVDASIAATVYGIHPFPYVRESLETISQWADVIVCSTTAHEALIREWREHDIAKYVRVIAGQEMGSKKEHIALASQDRYRDGRVLMIGDAPGDMNAAKANNALFFPINPGHEEESWDLFLTEGAHRFKNEEYSGDYETELIEEFENLLPSTPPWVV